MLISDTLRRRPAGGESGICGAAVRVTVLDMVGGTPDLMPLVFVMRSLVTFAGKCMQLSGDVKPDRDARSGGSQKVFLFFFVSDIGRRF
jgi:hypothetical protein